MYKVKNITPQQLKDTRKLRNFYKEFNLIPYAGASTYTSHKFLKFLCDLYDLSGSHANCINDLIRWCFTGELDIVEKKVEGLKQERNGIGLSQKIEIAGLMKELGLSLVDIIRLTSELFREFKKTGNAYLHYKEVQVGSTKKVFLYVVHASNAMYLNTKDNEPRAIVISKNFFEGTFSNDEPPHLVRVYPEFSNTSTGRETIIHLKYKRDESDWYGRPETLHVTHWKVVEWYSALHSVKVNKSENVSTVGFAVQNPDPNALTTGESAEDHLKKFKKGLLDASTNRGSVEKVDSMFVFGYPHGGKPPEMYQIPISRDVNYSKYSIETASDYIYAAHHWSKILNGFERARGGIGGNVLIDEFITKNESIVKPTQRAWENHPWQTVFSMMAEFSGNSVFNEIGIQFDDNISLLVGELKKNLKNGTTDNNGTERSDTDVGSEQVPANVSGE